MPRANLPITRSTGLSAILHGALLLAIFGVLHHAPQLATYKLPGTSHGTTLLTYYSPGSPQKSISDLALKTPTPPAPTPTRHTTALAAPTPPIAEQAQRVESGTGSSALSGIGEGDITIALQKFFPYPRPSLSTLPYGTRGDVILNAVIDEQGHIADLTVLHGLGPTIDDAVIATVRQWTYTPALKNGSPVRSEQELHFHYERG